MSSLLKDKYLVYSFLFKIYVVFFIGFKSFRLPIQKNPSNNLILRRTACTVFAQADLPTNRGLPTESESGLRSNLANFFISYKSELANMKKALYARQAAIEE